MSNKNKTPIQKEVYQIRNRVSMRMPKYCILEKNLKIHNYRKKLSRNILASPIKKGVCEKLCIRVRY
jgi:hypothetical protein